MKNLLLVLIFNCFAIFSFGQIDLNIERKNILEKGIKLYKLERSAWISSDSTANKINDINISGFVSYFDTNTIKVLFYEKITDDDFLIHFTLEFDTTINVNFLNINNQQRRPKSGEKNYIELREGTLDLISHFEKLYTNYENTGKNVAILKEKGKYKIYLMTGSNEYGILPIGNDYEFECKENESIIEYIGKLHQNYMPINYIDMPKNIKAGVHSHSSKSSDFITPTDICTLLLYKDLFTIKEHIVISGKYVSVFNNETLNLLIMNKTEYNKKYNTSF